MAKWHPLLQAWEVKRPSDLSPKEHEQKWSEEGKPKGTKEKQLRDELNKLRQDLKQYADALAVIAGVEESTEESGGW